MSQLSFPVMVFSIGVLYCTITVFSFPAIMISFITSKEKNQCCDTMKELFKEKTMFVIYANGSTNTEYKES